MSGDSNNQATANGAVLACDVGNSRTKFGWFESGRERLPVCRQSAVFASFHQIEWEELAGWFDSDHPSRCRGVLAGTHVDGLQVVAAEWERVFGRRPTIVTPADLQRCLRVDVDHPERVGIDRLLNAVAGNAIRSPNEPLVIVDSGTATTVDYVDCNGTFAGGAILPGFEMSARSLHEYTSLLPYLGIEQLAAGTPPGLGRNTEAAIHSGLYWGQIGAVTRLIEELSGGDDLTTVVTGGGAEILANHLPQARRERHLTLQGLVLAAGGNS